MSKSGLAPLEVREQLRTETFEYFLSNGIQTEEELALFVEEYFNYMLPRTNICPEHVSPMSFLADQFFERVGTSLGFANRGGGKTIIVAILNILDALFKPGVDIASTGAIKQQADRGYDYVRQFLFGEPLLLGQLVNSIQSSTDFRNGSNIQILTGSYHGLNSPHPVKFRCDEVELMHWSVLQEGLQMSIGKKGYRAQDTLTSTRKFHKGTMQKLLDEADKRNIRVYSWCIFEVLERCERKCHGDPVYGDCPAYSLVNKQGQEVPMCGGIAHQCHGWYKIEDFVKKVTILDEDTWNTQWRNLRPSMAVLVYGEFFKDEEPWVCEPFKIPKEWVRVSGIDFGSNFSYLKAAINPLNDTWYVYHEYFSTVDRSLEEHAMFMSESPDFNRKEWCFADPAGKQAITDLNRIFKRKKGPSIYSANNDVYAGISMVKAMFQRNGVTAMPRLRIFKNCTNLRRELSTTYSHKLEKDGNANKDIIVKKDDHNCDALRYLVYSYNAYGKPYVRTSHVKGLY